MLDKNNSLKELIGIRVAFKSGDRWNAHTNRPTASDLSSTTTPQWRVQTQVAGRSYQSQPISKSRATVKPRPDLHRESICLWGLICRCLSSRAARHSLLFQKRLGVSDSVGGFGFVRTNLNNCLLWNCISLWRFTAFTAGECVCWSCSPGWASEFVVFSYRVQIPSLSQFLFCWRGWFAVFRSGLNSSKIPKIKKFEEKYDQSRG